MSKRYAIILAAGRGKRFKSSVPKVLHPLCGKPLIVHVLDKLVKLPVQKVFVVVGRQQEQVRERLRDYTVEWIVQPRPLGTGDALRAAASRLKNLIGSLLVLNGDTPMVRAATLQRLYRVREQRRAGQALLTAFLEDPIGYGRIIRDAAGQLTDIVEEKDATSAQKTIREINTGLTCFDIASLLQVLPRLRPSPRTGEYYLTDLPRLLTQKGKQVVSLTASSFEEILGVNDRLQLAAVAERLRGRIARKWMRRGATLLDPATIYIEDTVRIGRDTVVYPGVVLEGQTRIGPDCIIHEFSHLRNATLGRGVVVDHGSVIRDSSIGKQTRVGPFAHLRGQTVVGPAARIGNFVEVKASRIGSGTKAAHLSYLGDSQIGKQVNIGAGTITCNYDGVNKHTTVIEDGVFVGSGSQLVAPVTLKRGAYVAAGSTITEDIPAGALGLARGRQITKRDWVSPQKVTGKKQKKGR